MIAKTPSSEVLLFTYFTGNGESGLHLAWSEDGYQWESLGNGRSFLRPEVGSKEKLMRDPCVALGPDGTYHLVWTSGWWERGIGHASTRDFLVWSPQREIPVMAHEPTARNAWAPEILWDEKRGDFLVFWATTVPGRFPVSAGLSEDDLNHRIYHVRTRDFTRFEPAELLYDPGFSVIDATFFRTPEGWFWVVKDERKFPEARKYLQIAAAESPTGPFGPLGAPITPNGLWVEGPTVVRFGDSWFLYFDAYMKKHYGLLRSTDGRTWRDETAKLRLPGDGTPQRVRHGTVICVPRTLIEALDRAPKLR